MRNVLWREDFKMKVTPVEAVVDYKKSPERQNDKHEDTTKETLKESWYMYSNTTTLHCICHLGNREYSSARRLFWIFLFFGLSFGFVYQVKILIQRYFLYSTVIKEVTIHENEPEFPTITICNINKIFNDSVTDPEVNTLLLNTYMSKTPNMTYFNSLNASFLNTVNLTKYFVTNPKMESQTAFYCAWTNQMLPTCQDHFQPVITSIGVCLAFNSKTFIKENGKALRSIRVGEANNLIVALFTYQQNYFIGDSAAAGFKVFVHDPDEEPRVQESSVIVSPGSATYIGMHRTERIYLPYPVKAFGDVSCVDTKSSGFKNYLKYYDTYSFYGCMTECETDYTVQICGCKDVLQPGESRVCNAYEYVTCVTEAKVNFSANGSTSCNCVLPCHSTTYNLQVSNAWYPSERFFDNFLGARHFNTEYARKNLVELRIYYESKLYTQQTQSLEITDNDMYGTLGGYMGLCFGASFGTLLELFEFLMNMCLNMIRKKSRRN